MSKDTGGSAFPKTEYNGDTDSPFNQTAGMTLRDYFAAKAIPDAVRWESASPTGEKTDARIHNGQTYKGIATRAYLMADAMLEARK